MFVAVGLPVDRVGFGDEFVSGPAVAEMSTAVEAVGFDAVFVTDHPFPDSRWLASGGHHALDPMVALSFAAAATKTLRLLTNLFVLPYRNPFLAAKQVSSLDVLSGGRVILGVGSGYLRPEFEALGAEFVGRGDVVDEAIDAMRAAWSGEPVTFDGRFARARGNVMLPKPKQAGGPPIWIGGNSKRAIRRAVEKGQGWLPIPSPEAASKFLGTPGIESHGSLAERIAYARDHAAEVGRTDPLDIVFIPKGLDGFAPEFPSTSQLVDELAALREIGVTGVVANVPAETRSQWRTNLEALAEAFR